jgi:hypothetical protein
MYANVCNVDHVEKILQENLARFIFLKFAVYHTISVLCDLLPICKPPLSRPPSAICRWRMGVLLELL